MNKTLVAIFGTEEAAFNGLSGLKDLHRNGDITLYDSAVIAKNTLGEIRVVKAPDDAPTGTFLGMFVGTLVGALGGPVGVAIGATTGTVAGATADLVRDSVDYSFVEEVSEALLPGMVAVVADVEETWVTPVDLTISEKGGVVFRRLRHEVVEDQLAREQCRVRSRAQGAEEGSRDGNERNQGKDPGADRLCRTLAQRQPRPSGRTSQETQCGMGGQA